MQAFRGKRRVPGFRPHVAQQLVRPGIALRPDPGAETPRVAQAQQPRAELQIEVVVLLRRRPAWQQALGQGDGRTAAAAACAHPGVPGVGRGAKQGVEGVRAQAQLGHVGLADHDGACGFHARGHDAVGARQLLFQDSAAHGAGKAQCVAGVLDGLGNAMQPATCLTSCQLLVTLTSLLQQGIGWGAIDDGVVDRVEVIDACQVGLHDVGTGDLACMDAVGKFAGRQSGDVGCHEGQKAGVGHL